MVKQKEAAAASIGKANAVPTNSDTTEKSNNKNGPKLSALASQSEVVATQAKPLGLGLVAGYSDSDESSEND